MTRHKLKLLLLQLAVAALTLGASVAMSLVLTHTSSIRRAPEKPASSMGEGEWQNRFHQVLDLFNQGKLAEADDMIGALLAERPGAGEIWQLKGSISYRRGLYEEAERAFRQAIRIEPYSAAGYNNLSQTLLHLDQKEAALAAVLRAVELSPENGAILLNAAVICAILEQDNKAVAFLKDALQFGVPPEAVSRNKALVALLEKPEVIKLMQASKAESASDTPESTKVE